MNESLFQILAGLLMLAAAIALIVAYRKYLAAGSERRMNSMLEAVGLDARVLSSADTETIVKEIRQRCQSCSGEDVCEHWLAGRKGGDNSFCPNARVFDELKKTRGAQG
ncbi:MAG: DUF6455 family protein [Gammaproteobacteria bacterium]|nr:DUF6455 family protein [Gammaproteobacteria bacterium]MDH3578494.1 DUF6455 family protein [Gammaproteobacteria bacterium]